MQTFRELILKAQLFSYFEGFFSLGHRNFVGQRYQELLLPTVQ